MRCSDERLYARGIDIAPYALSHLAYRVPEWDLYVHVRTLLERHAAADAENVWNGRPISKILLPSQSRSSTACRSRTSSSSHRSTSASIRMGLEHIGVVVGEDMDEFSRVHRAALTGQQFQSAEGEPYYILFEDFTHVKLYRRSLYDGMLLQGATSTAPTSTTGSRSGSSPPRTEATAPMSVPAKPSLCHAAAGPSSRPYPSHTNSQAVRRRSCYL